MRPNPAGPGCRGLPTGRRDLHGCGFMPAGTATGDDTPMSRRLQAFPQVPVLDPVIILMNSEECPILLFLN